VLIHGLFNDFENAYTIEGATVAQSENWLENFLLESSPGSRLIGFNDKSERYTRTGMREKALRLLSSVVDCRKV